MLPVDAAPVVSPSPLAHVRTSFSFVAGAPLHKVAPLFGAEGERAWAGSHWDPRFLYPQPPQDIEGAVFAIPGSIWVNTQFDPQAGRIQYVAFIPDAVVTIIDLKLTPRGQAATQVDVTYRRTALVARANAQFEELGKSDAAKGPEWQSAIAAALDQSTPAPGSP